jgi:hypothetical protein
LRRAEATCSGPISLLLPLALWAFELARRSDSQRWWWLSRLALVSIPLSGQVHLALAAIPFYFLYAICRTRAYRPLFEASVGVVAAILAGVFIRYAVIEGSIDQGGRSLSEVKVYSATGLDLVTRHARHGSEAFVFLGWLTPLAAIAGLVILARTGRGWLAIALGVGAAVPVFLAFGAHNPVYRAIWHDFPPLRYPRVPERMLPVACLAIAGLVAVTIDWALRRKEARRVPTVAVGAIVAVLLLADLHVRVFHPSAADAHNKAYGPVRAAPKGRLVELPVFLPDVHYGSTYLYYEQRVRRERPLGYSTTAPVRADVVARHLEPLTCGDWTTGAGARLAILKVAAITLHRGLYTANPLLENTAWFAWQGLAGHGWRPDVTDGAGHDLRPRQVKRSGPVSRATPGDAIFCQGWFPPDQLGRQMSSSHAALWVRGPWDRPLLRPGSRADRDPGLARRPAALAARRSAVARGAGRARGRTVASDRPRRRRSARDPRKAPRSPHRRVRGAVTNAPPPAFHRCRQPNASTLEGDPYEDRPRRDRAPRVSPRYRPCRAAVLAGELEPCRNRAPEHPVSPRRRGSSLCDSEAGTRHARRRPHVRGRDWALGDCEIHHE